MASFVTSLHSAPQTKTTLRRTTHGFSLPYETRRSNDLSRAGLRFTLLYLANHNESNLDLAQHRLHVPKHGGRYGLSKPFLNLPRLRLTKRTGTKHGGRFDLRTTTPCNATPSGTGLNLPNLDQTYPNLSQLHKEVTNDLGTTHHIQTMLDP